MDTRYLLLCCAIAAMSHGSLAAESVSVELSSDLGRATHRASGFPHAMSALEPRPEFVDPLKPKLFPIAAEGWHNEGAGTWASHDRARRLGARLQIVVSDNRGYALANWWPGDVGIAFTGTARVPWLARLSKVRVTADRIPDFGFEELAASVRAIDKVKNVSDGGLSVGLPAFGPSGACDVTLEPVEQRKESRLEYSFDIWDWTAPARDLELFDKWVADLKSAGLTRVELSTPWNLLEPEPGKIDLSFIRDRLAVCKKHGLGMRLRINSYYAGCTPAWYRGDVWQDVDGQPVMGIPSIADERFWEHYVPLCTAIAREFRGEDILYNAFIGVHAELKYSDWWTYDPSSLRLWSQAIKSPRPKWLARVVGDAPLPERPPVPALTEGSPDSDPANLAFIAFREQMWRIAVEKFTKAIRAGDARAKISSPLGESYRTLSAAFSNLDYWGMTRGSDQVVHSYDFFWHPGRTPMWHVRAVIETFQGITGLPVVFEFDGLSKIKQFGYTDQISKQMVRAIIDSGAGIKIANMSYPQELPSTSPVVRFAGEQIAQAGAPRTSVTSLSPDQTVLLFFSKWANYRYRERTEWLHDAQFGVWKLLRDMAIPVRVICEDNLGEDLTRYKGLVLAFSPVDVMPAEDRVAIERLGLPIVADVWEVPQAPPSGPGDLNGTEANRSGQSQNRVVIGKAIGYHYLHGADRTVCRRVMEQAMVKAGVRR